MVKNRYCLQTAKTYSSVLEKFFRWAQKDFTRISNQDIDDYIEILLVEKLLSQSYYNQFISAFLKFNKIFYKRRFRSMLLQRPTKETKLPEILSETEIVAVINAIENKKHKAIITFTYAHGLRISELINFHINCFDKARGLIHIKGGKGKKDREVPFAENIKDILTDYFLEYKPMGLLFQGQNGHYSKTSVRNILNRAVVKAGINKDVHPHTLRHSYATHLHEQGYDIADIQKILGHAKIETTQLYARISSKYLAGIKLKTQFKQAS